MEFSFFGFRLVLNIFQSRIRSELEVEEEIELCIHDTMLLLRSIGFPNKVISFRNICQINLKQKSTVTSKVKYVNM
jgi:hypothetical protein